MTTKKSVPKASAKKSAPKAAAPKKKVVAKAKAAPAADKKASLQQQLAALHAQMAALNHEAVSELKTKIGDTKKVLRGYELQLETLTGNSTAPPKGKRNRRPSILSQGPTGSSAKAVMKSAVAAKRNDAL